MRRRVTADRQAEAARKLGRLMECIRLLDLNRWDSGFKTRSDSNPRSAAAYGLGGANLHGPDICYVVDTNFIQSFIQPSAWSRVSHLFHEFQLWPWNESEAGDRDEAIDLQNAASAQSTFLATEFVLSEALESASGKLFMSSWHQIELATQIEELAKHHESIGSESFAAHAMKRQQRICECLKIRECSAEDFQKIIVKDKRFIGADVNVGGLSRNDLDRLKDNYVLSLISREISQDDIVEPGLQIQRINSLWERIQTVDWAFSPKGDADRSIISDLEAEWTKVLKDELGRRSRRENDPDAPPRWSAGKTGRRDEKSIPADARTMAYLTWLSQKMGDTRRIVFVTGDRLIINAYRRWYAKAKDEIPFILRPIGMYAPQYNFRDARSIIADQAMLFERTRQALELWTYPMGSSLRQHYLEDRKPFSRYDDARARDRFCLDAAEGKVSGDLLQELIPLSGIAPVLERNIDKMDQTADHLRWLERLGLGSVPDLLRPRVIIAERWAADVAAAFDDIANDAPDSEGVLEKLAKQHLTSVQEGGFAFSLPAAAHQIARFARHEQDARSVRAKVGVRLDIPFKGRLLPAADWIRAISQEEDAQPFVEPLGDTPPLAFALASWLALRQSRWGEAIRFAGFASRASEIDESSNADHDETLGNECRYLKAMALRIRMMSEAPRPDHHKWDSWKQDFVVAEAALATCIARHGEREPVRRLRDISERAALRLTYCGWAAVGHLAELGVYQDRHLELEEIFRGAVEDLQECGRTLPVLMAQTSVRAEDQHSGDRADMLARVTVQQAVNPECARLIYTRLTTRTTGMRDEVLMRKLPEAEAMLFQSIVLDDSLKADEHSMAKAYATTLSARLGIRPDEAVISSIFEDAKRGSSLALDRAMVAAMVEFMQAGNSPQESPE